AKVFTLSVSAYLDEGTIVGAAGGDREVEQVLREAPEAVSLALGPMADLLGDPIQGGEGILYADIDLAESVRAKLAHDVVAGYQRMDVFDFKVNKRRQTPITIVNDTL